MSELMNVKWSTFLHEQCRLSIALAISSIQGLPVPYAPCGIPYSHRHRAGISVSNSNTNTDTYIHTLPLPLTHIQTQTQTHTHTHTLTLTQRQTLTGKQGSVPELEVAVV